MKHVAILEHDGGSRINGKSAEQRATGRFYTHELIGQALARASAAAVTTARSTELRLIDPFCGDGRLVAWLVEALSESGVTKVVTSAWDQEGSAVASARELIEGAAGRCGVNVELDLWTGDTFARAAAERQRWDIVITNPPWELLKPDHRELNGLPTAMRAGYIAELKAFDRRLAAHYPVSQPTRRFAGWGTNLSRVGTEVAGRLTAAGGVCAVVCPTSLLADTTTAPLRRWLLDQFALIELAHYPAEARLFPSVDVPCCTFVAVRGARQGPVRVSRMDAARCVGEPERIIFDSEWLKRRDFAIPVEFGVSGIGLLKHLDRFDRFVDLEGNGSADLWAGRELDETGRAGFTRRVGSRPFVRSRNVARLEPVSLPADEFVDESKRTIPASANCERLVWRDISRPSQRRRIHATLLPAGPVTGNSVSVAHFRDESPYRLRVLLGLVSSLSFEFQVRSLLMTNHVSLSVMRAARLPALEAPGVADIAALVDSCITSEQGAEDALEVATARAFELDYVMWSAIADHFDLSDQRRASLDRAWGT